MIFGKTRISTILGFATGPHWLALLVSLMTGPDAMAATQPASLRERALAGDAWAQLNLGAAHDHGIQGFPKDAARAVHWYRKAAEQGIAEAQFNLGHCLATGNGVAQDYAAARYWMERAARQELADAQFLLGVMLDQGLGGPVDAKAAGHWLRQAAVRGQRQAAQYIEERR